jgi:hypothetical protein
MDGHGIPALGTNDESSPPLRSFDSQSIGCRLPPFQPATFPRNTPYGEMSHNNFTPDGREYKEPKLR